MAESKFEQVSISELARILGVDRRTIAKRLKALGEEATLEEIIGALLSSEGIEEARRRKVMAEAEFRELKLKQEQGGLIAKSAVVQALVRVLGWYRMEVAIHLPGRIAGKLVGKTEREIATILTQELGRIFDAGRDHAAIFGSNAGSVSARRTERVRVGRPKSRAVG